MEIPYIVDARKDTGLFNSKMAIWLFLASEVMLFGGLFSAYVFLRLGADYPWPERALPILPGLINTAILIASSMTVLFAWAALKLRKWRLFQVNMAITIICAVAFMVIKSFEYNAKFHHQAIRMTDDAVIEGHLVDEKHGGLGNYLRITGNSINIPLADIHMKFVEEIIQQIGATKTSLVIGQVADTKAKKEKATNYAWSSAGAMYATASIQDGQRNDIKIAQVGDRLTIDLLKKIQKYYLKARTQRHNLNADLMRQAWKQYRQENPTNQQRDDQVKSEVTKIYQQLQFKYRSYYNLAINGSVQFKLAKPVMFVFKPSQVMLSDKQQGQDSIMTFKGGITIKGKAADSSLLIDVDSIDFRYMVMAAEKEGKKVPTSVIKHAEILKNPRIKQIWDTHQQWLAFHAKALLKIGHKPTENEMYRVTWEQMVAYNKVNYQITAENWNKLPIPTWFEGFVGANHYTMNKAKDSKKRPFPQITIPRQQIAIESKLTPKWNNYYGIYFIITGLHGLHVVGGIIVLAYFLFFGKKMYRKKPEWLTNRVEVVGLFWHFVDLVWIFLFPIFYLM